MGTGLRTWKVERDESGWQKLVCPNPKCQRVIFVDAEWPEGGANKGYIARPCVYCFVTAKLPGGPALIYDSHDTLRVTEEIAEALAIIGKVRYSPEDGPNGIVYRPTGGLSVKDVAKWVPKPG